MNSATVRASVVGAAAAVAVAVAGVIGGSIGAYFQHKSDSEKLQATILVELVRNNDQLRAEYTSHLLRAGILKDNDGAICRAFVKVGVCPIKALTSN
jgi:hypothetical protein